MSFDGAEEEENRQRSAAQKIFEVISISSDEDEEEQEESSEEAELTTTSNSSDSDDDDILYPPLPTMSENGISSDSSDLPEFIWTDETETLFFQSFISKKRALKPVGVNKHFVMLLAHARFTKALRRNVDVEILWNKLESLYDMDLLEQEESGKAPFPNEQSDYKLPEHFKKNKNSSSSSDDDNENNDDQENNHHHSSSANNNEQTSSSSSANHNKNVKRRRRN